MKKAISDCGLEIADLGHALLPLVECRRTDVQLTLASLPYAPGAKRVRSPGMEPHWSHDGGQTWQPAQAGIRHAANLWFSHS